MGTNFWSENLNSKHILEDLGICEGMTLKKQAGIIYLGGYYTV
jgi:hypothetical protein